MHNHLFTAPQLALLASPARWRFVASGLPEEMRPMRRCAHDAWMRRHAHSHPHCEITMILSGGGYWGCRGRSYALRPGMIFLLDAMEPHDMRFRPGRRISEHLWFCFTQGQCGVSLLQAGMQHKRGGYRDLWHRSYPFAELGLSSPQVLFPDRGGIAPTAMLRRHCVASLSVMVTSLVAKGYQPSSATRSASFSADVVRAIVRHIQESHGRGCQLDHLARIAGYSKYHFLRLFHARTGMSVHECVDESRIKGFRQMSAAGLPLKVITEELGFTYPSALCHWRRQRGL